MTQISRPFQIVLAAFVVFAALWFTVLHKHSSSSGESASAPQPAASTPAQSEAGGGTPASKGGVYHGSAQDRADGFLHFSTAAQIVESARRHRAGQEGLLLVAVEAARLGDRLRWETSRGGDLFPHLYGPLAPTESASVRPLPLGPDGLHVFPELA